MGIRKVEIITCDGGCGKSEEMGRQFGNMGGSVVPPDWGIGFNPRYVPGEFYIEGQGLAKNLYFCPKCWKKRLAKKPKLNPQEQAEALGKAIRDIAIKQSRINSEGDEH